MTTAVREFVDALDLFTEVITLLPAQAQAALLVLVLVLGALGVGVVKLSAGAARWCWRTTRGRRQASPVADGPEPRP